MLNHLKLEAYVPVSPRVLYTLKVSQAAEPKKTTSTVTITPKLRDVVLTKHL